MNRATLVYIIFGCLHFVSVFLLPGWVGESPERALFRRNWGYHFLTYYPIPIVAFAYATFAASLIPSVQRQWVSALKYLREGFKGQKHTHVYLAVGVVATLILWGLQQKYPFLGDVHVRSGELDGGEIHESGTIYIELLLAISRGSGLSGRRPTSSSAPFSHCPSSSSPYWSRVKSDRTSYPVRPPQR